MSALAKAVEPALPSNEKPDDMLIHVRFTPSAEIFTIDARPDQMSARAWYQHLLAGASQHYQTLAGGRGFFRIPRPAFEQLLATAGQ